MAPKGAPHVSRSEPGAQTHAKSRNKSLDRVHVYVRAGNIWSHPADTNREARISEAFGFGRAQAENDSVDFSKSRMSAQAKQAQISSTYRGVQGPQGCNHKQSVKIDP